MKLWKEYCEMKNLKKIVENFKRRLPGFLFLIITAIPAFASIQKGESFALQGKFNEAMAALSPLVAKNDPRALYLMAVIYLSPASNHLNIQKGLAFLERAVFQNYGPALDEFAGLYLVGEGVPKDEEKALHYYIQAAHIGYGPSQFNCGIMYKKGQGTKKDPVKAYLYLSLAAFNYKDLGEVTLDAAKYRDELVPHLSSKQRHDVLRQFNALTLPQKSIKGKRVTS